MHQYPSGKPTGREFDNDSRRRDSTRLPIALVAIIGPYAHDLVAPLVTYYSGLGVTEFRIALHIPPETPAAHSERLVAACERAIGRPDLTSRGPWGPENKGLLTDRLRALAVADWHVLADSDEFQFHAGGIESTIDRCVARGLPFTTGLLVDRLTAAGDVRPGGSTPGELDDEFPLGSFLTTKLLDGDPRKITVAHREVNTSAGCHVTLTHAHLEPPAPLPVHHFKWRTGVREYLAERAGWFEGSALPLDRCVRKESLTAVKLLSRGLVPGKDGLATFPASLEELPANWDEMAAPIWRYWQVDRWRRRARRTRLRRAGGKVLRKFGATGRLTRRA